MHLHIITTVGRPDQITGCVLAVKPTDVCACSILSGRHGCFCLIPIVVVKAIPFNCCGISPSRQKDDEGQSNCIQITAHHFPLRQIHHDAEMALLVYNSAQDLAPAASRRRLSTGGTDARCPSNHFSHALRSFSILHYLKMTDVPSPMYSPKRVSKSVSPLKITLDTRSDRAATGNDATPPCAESRTHSAP